MNLKKTTSLALITILYGCTQKTVMPYESLPLSPTSANLRVVTNGEVRGGTAAGCLQEPKNLAKAGRFGRDGRVAINFLQVPATPPVVNMLPRFAPKLPQYLGIYHMAEGAYTEVVAEYRIPTDAPFLLTREKLYSGGFSDTYETCPASQKLFIFEPGKSYEALVGIQTVKDTDGNNRRRGPFFVYELKAGKGGPLLIEKLDSYTPAVKKCATR